MSEDTEGTRVGTMAKVPGQSHWQGIVLMELAERFPNEKAAQDWFQSIASPNGEITYLKCGSWNAYRTYGICLPSLHGAPLRCGT